MTTVAAVTLFATIVATPRVQRLQCDACVEFDRLYVRIRDGAVGHEDARQQIRELLPRVREAFASGGGQSTSPDGWRFPLRGYGAESIGGKNGSGYTAAGYDYFDGYKSHGHPGHDLLIHDTNRDELDDVTGKPVEVLSISSGIVVAYAPEWPQGSQLRGGRYLYIYDPLAGGMFYYAHNRALLVTPGDVVRPGQPIATVGRSGRNASAARSPTHLHVMFLVIEDGYPKPRDIYKDLRRLGGKPVARARGSRG